MAGPVVSGVVVEVVVVAAVVGDVEGDVVGVGGTEVETGPSAGSDAGTVDGGASEVDVDVVAWIGGAVRRRCAGRHRQLVHGRARHDPLGLHPHALVGVERCSYLDPPAIR